MTKIEEKPLLWIVLIGASYHLIRDFLQIASVESLFSNIGHWEHNWCGQYCDYVTLPIDLALIITSVVSIRTYYNRRAEIAIAIILLIGLLMFFLP